MTSSAYSVRAGTAEDYWMLRRMLYEAAFWRSDAERPPPEDALAHPHLDRYVRDWGQPGDASVIAVDRAGRAVGAAWYRKFPLTHPGYGFLDEAIPEVSIGVDPHHRNRGVGTTLLRALLERAAADEVPAVSLSVEKDNPACSLYARVGFRVVKTTEGAWTMRYDLRPAR